MDRSDFSFLVARLERQAANSPGAYAFKVAALAALGYLSLFVIAAALALSACTKVSTPAEGGPTAGSAPTLQAVLQRGTLRVGDCLTFAPFGFYNKDGQPDGYDVDLA